MAIQETLTVRTSRRRELLDLTDRVRDVVRKSGVAAGTCHVFVTGATAAIIVNENDDPQLLDDFMDAFDRLVPEGRWRHDRIDDNGAAHIKAAALGPGEILPIAAGDLALGRWQNIFLCEFDGPRGSRDVIVTIHGG
ncbi:MAG: YjbQ family protein [Candidatus Eisenbacteria bacterium]|nr:YjbQ family protein [Candidatus Latescibacterota bacterium]MBD3302219.1 YjbQ family protein [Candidatus Eisenbacteria bacterium]